MQSFPLNASLTWGPGDLTTTAGYSYRTQVDSLPGSVTNGNAAEASAEVGRTFRLPADWGFRSGLRTRLGFQQSHTKSYVENLFAALDRSRLTDNGRQAFTLNADTDVAENATFSIQGSRIVNFDRNLNRRITQTVDHGRPPNAVLRRRSEVRMNLLACALLLLGACDRSPTTPTTPFDGEIARGYVKTQLDFGARVPGTEAARKTGDWIVAQMRQRADTVIEQRWNHVTAKGDTLPLRNIFARFRPQASTRILYVTHWDSRPVSDQAEDPAKRIAARAGRQRRRVGCGRYSLRSVTC